MFVAYHGVDASTHQQRFDELLSQGLRMTWVNVSGDPADARYAAVWVTSDGRGWAGAHNLDAAGYQRRPATAHNTRTIRANWGYVRPEKRKVVPRRRPHREPGLRTTGACP